MPVCGSFPDARVSGVSTGSKLVGLVLQSFLAMLIFGTALTLVTAVFTLTGSLGWLPVTGLAIAVLIVGFRLRRLLDSLTTMMRPGAGSIMLGGLARRGAMGAVRRIAGALSSRGAAPTPAERGDRIRQSDPSPQRVSSVQVYRRAPVVGTLARASSASSPYELTTGAEKRRADSTTPGGGSSPGGQSGPGVGDLALAGNAAPSRNTSALNLARARAQSKSEGRRTISVSAAAVAATGGSSGTSSRGASAEVRKARHSRRPIPAPSQRDQVRAEDSHALGESSGGASEGRRIRRKSPTSQQRRFREYSAVTKDGVTVHVPTRR